MSWTARASAAAVRSCPMCGSGAVAALRRTESDTDPPAVVSVPVVVLCGECGTWRRCRLRRSAARAFKRHLRRDRRRLARSSPIWR